jgi:hypothetical protein
MDKSLEICGIPHPNPFATAPTRPRATALQGCAVQFAAAKFHPHVVAFLGPKNWEVSQLLTTKNGDFDHEKMWIYRDLSIKSWDFWGFDHEIVRDFSPKNHGYHGDMSKKYDGIYQPC